jgi:hypothetical protein
MVALGTIELARVAYAAGSASYRSGNYSAALEHFREASRQDVDPTGNAINNTMTWIAICYARLNRCSDALDSLEDLRSYWSDPVRDATMRSEATNAYNRCTTAATTTASHESLHETPVPTQTVATTTQPTSEQASSIVDTIFNTIWGTTQPTAGQILDGPSQPSTTTGTKPTTGKPGVTAAQSAPSGNRGAVPAQPPVRSPVRVELPGSDTNTWLLYGGLGVAGVALLGGILYLAFRSKPQDAEGVKS